MNPSKSEGLKIGLAGMIGCLLALMFTWHWSASALIRALAIPIGFLAGWIAYAPISFFTVFPKVWHRVSSWRPPAGAGIVSLQGLVFLFGAVNVAILILLPQFVYTSLSDMDMSELNLAWILAIATLLIGLAILGVGLLGQINFALAGLLIKVPTDECGRASAIKQEKDLLQKLWNFWLHYNALTIPFLMTYHMIRLPIKTLIATPAFLLHLIRAWAELTASNGRLTSGLAAAFGTGICLWQDWPPVPGCLTGFATGIALWGSAVLALRFLPAPRPIAAVA